MAIPTRRKKSIATGLHLSHDKLFSLLSRHVSRHELNIETSRSLNDETERSKQAYLSFLTFSRGIPLFFLFSLFTLYANHAANYALGHVGSLYIADRRILLIGLLKSRRLPPSSRRSEYPYQSHTHNRDKLLRLAEESMFLRV